MNTNIECTNCREVSEVTANSIMLPFVCSGCENDAEQYEKMAPGVQIKSYAEFPNLITEPPCQTVGGQYGQEEPSHDATVENTTLLIADLEEQVTFATEALAKSTELVNELSAELQDTVSVVSERDRRLSEVLGENSRLNTLNNKLMMNLTTAIDKITRLESDQNDALRAVGNYVQESLQIADDADKAVRGYKNQIALLHAEVTSWKKATSTVMAERTRLREKVQTYQRWMSELRVDITTLRRRGLLARIRNVGA